MCTETVVVSRTLHVLLGEPKKGIVMNAPVRIR
jgi:hypothetical protein